MYSEIIAGAVEVIKDVAASETAKDITAEVVADAEIAATDVSVAKEAADVNSAISEMNSIADEAWDISKKEVEYYSTYEERIMNTPKEGWTGERGESMFIPQDAKTIEKLNEYGLKGIEYKNGIPDFSKCSVYSVKIDMTEIRYSKRGELGNKIIGNFEKADTKIAEIWNQEMREGKNTWTYKDVEDWRHRNNYTIHEDADKTTCYIMPLEIHEPCKHLGGIAECKRKIGIGGGFDE